MAIIFNQEISETKILFAYNNNIVRFYTDSPLLPMFAEITIGPYTLKLFPNPNGEFYYNYSDLVKTIMNTDNLKDDLNIDIQNIGFIYNWTYKVFLNPVITYKIVLDNLSEETDTRTYNFLSGAIQLEEYKKRYPLFLNKENTIMLSPFVKDNNQKAYVRYWVGYPFDITVYVSDNATDLYLENSTNLTNVTLTPTKVFRLAFSDGQTTSTIEDVISLQYGYNEMKLEAYQTTFYFDLIKEEGNCGTYLKFRNSLGGWNYWLFPKGHRDRTAKDIGEIQNDYENIEDTISPKIQIGRSTSDTITLTTDILNENDMILMEELIDSPKIYMYTGSPFSQSEHTDWIEISFKTTNFRIENARSILNRFNFQFELPKRNNVTI